MLTLQEISDRLELERLSNDYALAIDKNELDALDNVFTPDALIDYTAQAGFKGGVAETKLFLRDILTNFRRSQHFISNFQFVIRGDRATGRAMCINALEPIAGNGSRSQTFFLGVWYVDSYVRTPSGWRIATRTEEPCWGHNVPEGLFPGG